MTVEATYQIDKKKLQEMELTIAISAKVSEWEEVLKLISGNDAFVPDCFSTVIRGVLRSFREVTDPPYRVTRWGDARVDKADVEDEA